MQSRFFVREGGQLTTYYELNDTTQKGVGAYEHDR